MKRKYIVKYYLVIVLAVFAAIIISTSISADKYSDDKYYEWNWFVYIGLGVLAFFTLLIHTMTLEKPRDFARLPIFEFFALSVLVVSLVLGVVLFPVEIFPDDLTIKKIKITTDIPDSDKDIKEWAISIGGIKEQENRSGLEIPIYILVAGNIGAYIRYLYGYIKGKVRTEEKKLEKLKDLYLLEKKIVNSLCIAAGIKYESIRRVEGIEVVKLKYMHKHYDNNRDLIFFLPPHTTSKLAEYVAEHFDKLYDVESKYEIKKFKLRSRVYKRTIKTIATFFLAPLLAVIAWLLLDLSGTDEWQTFAIVGFSAGLATNAIIQRIWSFMGEKLKDDDEEDSENDEEPEKKPKPEAPKPESPKPS